MSGQNMSAKIYSTFFTVNWLLGLAGATVACGSFSLMAFAQQSVVPGALLLAIAVLVIGFASRVRFPKEEEISQESILSAQVIGGPIFRVCFLKMKGRWRWFCIGPGSRRAFERVFAIDI
jgi:hypothetical protein